MTLQLRGETPSTTALPEYTAARAAGKTAIYLRHPGDANWTLLLTEEGEAESTLVALGSTGAETNTIDDITHLLDEGTFPARIEAFVAPTAISMLRAEAGLLRKQAKAAQLDAGMSGSWGDGGANRLIARAEAYEHAIALIEKYGVRH